MAKPPKRNEMSDMVHRIKTENAKGFPQFNQGNAPMPKGCICPPMDYAALGHMMACPLFKD